MEFVLALGYKADVIKKFFLELSSTGSNFTVSTASGDVEIHDSTAPDWKVTLIDTGLDSLTGERIARVGEYLKRRAFLSYLWRRCL